MDGHTLSARASARVVVTAALSLAAACAGDDVPPPDAGDGDGAVDGGVPTPAAPPFLRDARGGVLVLRGTNVSGYAKSAPDHLPREGFEDFVRLRSELGLNAIRLLVFWEAIEPAPGAYDDAYLASVRSLAALAGEAGLVVLVDMHQDVWGEGFGFAGAPRWACDEALYAAFVTPPQWYLGYFDPSVMACFDRLYEDAALRASFAAAWARLARELRDVPSIIAYELLNEPSWGSGTPADFDRRIAPAFYAEVIDAIRAQDPQRAIALEPAPSASIGLPAELRVPDRPGLLYAPHVYPIALERGDGYDGDRDRLAAHVGGVMRDAARLGLAPLVTEVGARPAVPRAIDYVRDVFDLFDAHVASAFQWEIRGGYDLIDATGAPTALGRAVARPYPARVAGTPRAFAWDATAGRFELTWDEDGTATGDSVVVLPAIHFPDGHVAALDDGGTVVDEGAGLRVPQRGGAGPSIVTRRLVVTAR